MLIIPAIDLKDHKVVRLVQGRMGEAKVYSDDPMGVAKKWIDQGATRIHVVDLNGAFEGRPVHFDEVEALVKKFSEVQFEIGGGIRAMETVDRYMKTSVQFCILGTAVIQDAELVKKACLKYPMRVILGIDSIHGKLATEGWGIQHEVGEDEVAQKYRSLRVPALIYTDVTRDGMLTGPNVSAIQKMARQSPTPIIASGGVTTLEDIKRIKKIKNVMGVIIGKALYEGKVDLREAIRTARED